ncbi:MAG: hypothetical protein A2W23_00325 [Planctomycetes bacterium RBG_16_43_13]|nr:MAG: hypothetical protein A2W23_00325 [Planctomycetes bacterium RBG_16_43_13]
MPHKTRKIKTGTLYRALELDRNSINKEDRTVEVSFSSESPIDRWFGLEILDHSPKSARLGRLNGGGALLLGHDTDKQVGVVEKAVIGADRKGRSVVRFGNSALANEVFNDVSEGIRRNVSVGYQIHSMILEEEKNDVATYRATDWEPLELSIVAIPADTSVGVGRGQEAEHETTITNREEKEMHKCEHCKRDLQEGEVCSCRKSTPVNVEDVKNEARKAEQGRTKEMLAIGEQHKCHELARKHIEAGTPLEEFRTIVLEEVYRKKLHAVQTPDPGIGLSDKEAREFSIVRAINALATRDFRLAPFEKECSDAVAKKFRRDPQGLFIPRDVQKRDLTKGSFAGGGATVVTELLAASFIELLRSRMMVRRMGANVLGGLVGDIAIPRQTGGATAYWVGENGAPPESQQTLGQLAMTPKTVGAYTDISRKLLMQSSIEVEGFVRTDLATVLAMAIDMAAIKGQGVAGEPLGIINTTGIGSVAGGTNGAAPTWAHIVSLWSEVANDNAAFGSLGFLTNTKAVGKLMTTEKASSTAQFVCPSFPDVDGMTNFGGSRAGVTNQVPSNLTKGSASEVCSAIIYGNWGDLTIGEWGTVDVLVDPYTGGAAGTLRVRLLQDIDIILRHVESFAAMLDALTT